MNIIELKNGLRVGNFSSPHDFKFDDGSILPAVSDKDAERLKVNFIETEIPANIHEDLGIKLISLDFKLSDEVIDRMSEWETFQKDGFVDVVLIPLPMLTAMKNDTDRLFTNTEILLQSPFRCIRIEDRINKLVSSSKFCI